MALTDNLVSYWKLDETSGTSAADAHGANTGTITGNPILGVTGKIAKAITLDGTGDYISIGDPANLDFERTSAFSIQAWLNLPTPGADMAIVGKHDVSTALRGYRFYIDAALKLYIQMLNDNGAGNKLRRASVQTVPANTWTHCVMTYSGSSTVAGGKIYINATESTYDSEQDTLTATILNNINLEIGRNGSGWAVGDFLGTIDEVGIWSRVLTGAEITELYNGGSGLAYPFTGGVVVRPRSNLLLMKVG